MKARPAGTRGFTLIELMVVVAIISMLASVAIPEFTKATLRTRGAERATILKAMRVGIEDGFDRGLIPPPPGLPGGPNPAGVAGTTKRPFQPAMAGWSSINMVVQGNCYYTYEFEAAESNDPAVPPQYTISGLGDLDGDGVASTKQIVIARGIGGWQPTSEVPAAGREFDSGVF